MLFSRPIRFQATEPVGGIDHPTPVAPADAAQEQPPNSEAATPAAPGRHNWLFIGLALLAVYVIWGSTYLAIRETLVGFPPFLGAGLRFLIAGSILYGFLRVRGAPNPNRRQWTGAAVVGGLLLVCGNGGVVFAEQSVASGVAALIVASVPLWAVLFARIWGRWPNGKEWIGLIVGFVGIIFLNLGGGLSATPIGAVTILLAAICWALGSVWSQHLTLPAGAMSSAAEMLVGGAALLGLGLVLNERFSGPPPPVAFWALAYLVVFGSLVGFSAYGYLLKRVRPALATSNAYANPLVALLLGAAFAGEQITAIELLALVFILTGVVLVALGREKRR
ncbi:MAG TPA: drug/metabolite exporter YedA [Ktedonobacterales bacterium]